MSQIDRCFDILEALHAWGWRVPFLLGLLIGDSGLYRATLMLSLIGARYFSETSLRALLEPIVSSVGAETGELTRLSMLVGGELTLPHLYGLSALFGLASAFFLPATTSIALIGEASSKIISASRAPGGVPRGGRYSPKEDWRYAVASSGRDIGKSARAGRIFPPATSRLPVTSESICAR